MILAGIVQNNDFDSLLEKHNSKIELSIYDKSSLRTLVLEADRKRMLASRFLLSLLMEKLGDNLSIDQIYYTEHGKPIIPDAYISISHSSDYVAVAVSKTEKMGIDIQKEEIINIQDYKSFLTETQIREMSVMDKDRKMKYFFSIWTKNEAIMKADGRGMELTPKMIVCMDNRAYVKDTETIWHQCTCPKIEGYSIALYSNNTIDDTKWLTLKGDNLLEIERY